jgi:hypothetical protein
MWKNLPLNPLPEHIVKIQKQIDIQLNDKVKSDPIFIFTSDKKPEEFYQLVNHLVYLVPEGYKLKSVYRNPMRSLKNAEIIIDFSAIGFDEQEEK